jgi:hypothetical protein
MTARVTVTNDRLQKVIYDQQFDSYSLAAMAYEYSLKDYNATDNSVVLYDEVDRRNLKMRLSHRREDEGE